MELSSLHLSGSPQASLSHHILQQGAVQSTEISACLLASYVPCALFLILEKKMNKLLPNHITLDFTDYYIPKLFASISCLG